MHPREKPTLPFVSKNRHLALTTIDINRKRKFYFRKPDFTLRLDDIEGARPKVRTSHLGRRCIDPLDPEYKLPSFEPVQPLIPTFRRCGIDISDIEKTTPQPNPSRINENKYGSKIIERSRTNPHQRTNIFLDSLNVKDINSYHIGYNAFKSRRTPTHPLQPRYQWDPAHAKSTIGPVKGSIPKKLHRKLKKAQSEVDFTLRTADVRGATVVHDRYRRDYRKCTTNTLDIDGAQANTVIKGFRKGSRRTNPLNPKYSALDTPPGSPAK